MRAKQTTALKTARARKPQPAPLGLSMLLALFDEIHEDDLIFAEASRHARDLGPWRNGHICLDPEVAVQTVYPGMTKPYGDHAVMTAGLMIGVALAWIAVTEMNGGAR